MPTTLPKTQRKLLEKVTRDARDVAERAARAALENLAVHEKDYRPHMTVEQRQLRNRLRARGRALGDPRDERSGTQGISYLAEDIAYEQWHRLLFTRFLTENNLLHTDEENGTVPVTLEECEELAPEMGARDGFDLACRFASRILPGVFRRNDPVLELRLAPNDEVELRRLLNSLPPEVFTADDSLGWTYQFWQAKRKDEVNASGKKIGADELAPVTQLFTEDYMVEFLLHNTLGAWWAGKLGPIHATSEDEARSRAALPARDGAPAVPWTYLRFVQDVATEAWVPAAGTFSGWPTSARLIRLLDPCMGSGHFLVFALPLLVALRMEEENLSSAQTVVAVLQDNLHGLELDERCTQIAAFNVALAAWKLSGYQLLPPLHLACSGLAPNATETEWVALVGTGDYSDRLRRGMIRLHDLFKYAPVLGSLINPRALAGNLIEAEFRELQALLEMALAQESNDDTAREMAVTAQGLAKAAEILAGQFTLVATNVPYLGRGKQDELLMSYTERMHSDARTDLATCFIERCFDFSLPGGSTALVTPQNWLFLGSYQDLRKRVLSHLSWKIVVRLGAHAFETITGEVVNVALLAHTKREPTATEQFFGINALDEVDSHDKKERLVRDTPVLVTQRLQLLNPDARVMSEDRSTAGKLLEEFAESYQGAVTGDLQRFVMVFWEMSSPADVWEPFRTSIESQEPPDGLSCAIRWESGTGQLADYARSTRAQLHDMHESGQRAWGKPGIAINRMRGLRSTVTFGEKFDNNVAVIVPASVELLLPILAFCSTDVFASFVRDLDQTLKVTNQTLRKVPFDLAYWQTVAAERYPHGLPKPRSDDPTQWLFSGHPVGCAQSLHVALARLIGYHWPRQTGSSFRDCPALGPDGLESLGDEDGIVCLPPLNREQPAAARLRQILTAALGTFDERALIATAGLKGSKSTTLNDWLRDECFEQHAKLFHDRPFLWHVWDGRPDGFHALVNYHRLDYAMLKKLTYTYLGDWLHQQEDEAKSDKPGAADRLGAARTLQNEMAKILEGEPPYDIFVRWKPLSQQAVGWHPDLNDGVRLNIRPFMRAKDVGQRGAGILRTKPNIKWEKDRGKEPVRDKTEFPWFWHETEPALDPTGGPDFTGHRWNNVHLSLDRKRQARARATAEGPLEKIPGKSGDE